MHDWNLTPKEAVELQKTLRERLNLQWHSAVPQRVAGVDVGFEEDGKVTRAAVAVLSFPQLELLESSIARQPTRFPYVPGLLSFREVPAILEALDGLKLKPDVLLCDGQGYAHPRRMGIACHLGLLTDIPSLGVGKSRLIGTHAEVPPGRGEWTPLMDKGAVIGAVLRSREACLPLYISPGQHMDLEQAVALTMACTTRYKLPETTRHAHKLASG